MRGKLVDAVNANHGDRITPADAGKTFDAKDIIDCMRDHPRGCGENFTFRRNFSNTSGSPPRMRGKH